MAEPEYSIVDRNLRAAMQFFGRASGLGAIEERDGMLLIDSGVGYSVFNIAMLTSPVQTARELCERIRVGAAYFGGRSTRWSMWVCEEMLAAALRPQIGAFFGSQGLRRLTEAPGMIADRIFETTRALPAVDCRRVEKASTRADFAHITCMNFDIPYATCQDVYGSEGAWAHDYHGYVGYVQGAPVATAAVVVAAESIGVYSVSTLPQFRRRGYAESLMRQVIARYTGATGFDRSVLQATRSGYDMYLKMGYRPVSRFTVFMS